MKSTVSRVLLVAIWGIISEATAGEDGPLPATATVAVSDTSIRVGFSWANAPAFPEDRAVEFSTTLYRYDNFLVPYDDEDFDPFSGFATSPNFPCPYRDIYNHSAGTPETVFSGLVSYCGYTSNLDTAGYATFLWGIIAATLDEDRQFAVGSRCPEDFSVGNYWFSYRTKRNIAYPGAADDHAFAWVYHDAVPRGAGCPLDIGDAWSLVGLGDGPPAMWLNRLCVPTGTWSFIPGRNVAPLDTSCEDLDDDEYFGRQSAPMFGTLIGDCDDADADVHPPSSFCQPCLDEADCLYGHRCDGFSARCFPCAATETCSTPLDDTCDGDSNDLNASGCTRRFLDSDTDGYGTAASSCRCMPLPPYTASATGDCNDSRADIHPGAADGTCDGTDEDCDGTPDEGCSSLDGGWHPSGALVKRAAPLNVVYLVEGLTLLPILNEDVFRSYRYWNGGEANVWHRVAVISEAEFGCYSIGSMIIASASPRLVGCSDGTYYARGDQAQRWRIDQSVGTAAYDALVRSWGFVPPDRTTSDPSACAYPVAPDPLRLRPGTLVKETTPSAVYFVTTGVRALPIFSEPVFEALDYQFGDVLTIPDGTLGSLTTSIAIEAIDEDTIAECGGGVSLEIVGTTSETCNGFDDDGDGDVDEGCSEDSLCTDPVFPCYWASDGRCWGGCEAGSTPCCRSDHGGQGSCCREAALCDEDTGFCTECTPSYPFLCRNECWYCDDPGFVGCCLPGEPWFCCSPDQVCMPNQQCCYPNPETCNGNDDDCDGSTDEDFGCRLGTYQDCVARCGAPGRRLCGWPCSWEPACVATTDELVNPCGGCNRLEAALGETCDGGDSDRCPDDRYECDGTEALRCTDGDDTPEVCLNGRDDDCNGLVDDGCTEACGSAGDEDFDGTPDCVDEECFGTIGCVVPDGFVRWIARYADDAADGRVEGMHVDPATGLPLAGAWGDLCDVTDHGRTLTCLIPVEANQAIVLNNPHKRWGADRWLCEGTDTVTGEVWFVRGVGEILGYETLWNGQPAGGCNLRILANASAPQPTPESCNGLDDDMNWVVDDGVANPCGGCGVLAGMPGDPCEGPDMDGCPDDVLACDATGALVCTRGSDDLEVCNGVDDDCDSDRDEGVTNACGGCTSLSSAPRSPCDGDDEDLCLDDENSCIGPDAVACSLGEDAAEVCDGLTARVFVRREWEHHRFCFEAVAIPDGHLRLTLHAGEVVGAVRMDNVVLALDACDPCVPRDELCNGEDDDCDDEVDNNIPALPIPCGIGACAAAGERACVNGNWLNTCQEGEPAAADGSCDGVDDDCSGVADEDFPVEATRCGQGSCASTGLLVCIAGTPANTCRAGSGASTDLTCDSIDDDCDGWADEDYRPVGTTCGLGICRSDGFLTCVAGSETDSCVMGLPAAETCNGADDNCDGTPDDLGDDTCGVGACRQTVPRCVEGVSRTCVPGSPTAEICANGIDDDCDGASGEPGATIDGAPAQPFAAHDPRIATYAGIDWGCNFFLCVGRDRCEFCGSGIDEDGDNLVDCDDPDCFGEPSGVCTYKPMVVRSPGAGLLDFSAAYLPRDESCISLYGDMPAIDWREDGPHPIVATLTPDGYFRWDFPEESNQYLRTPSNLIADGSRGFYEFTAKTCDRSEWAQYGHLEGTSRGGPYLRCGPLGCAAAIGVEENGTATFLPLGNQ